MKIVEGKPPVPERPSQSKVVPRVTSSHGTNQANKAVSWSDVVSGKKNERDTNDDDQERESLF